MLGISFWMSEQVAEYPRDYTEVPPFIEVTVCFCRDMWEV